MVTPGGINAAAGPFMDDLARASRRARTLDGGSMDAIGILEKEHEDAKEAMHAIFASKPGDKKRLFSALKRDLELHDRIEEQVFDPMVEAHLKTAGFQARDKQAHEDVEAALARLDALAIDDKDWAPSFLAMQALLLRHVADEEVNIFGAVRKHVSAGALEALGQQMRAAKAEQHKAA